jgi:hypothetical protein
MSGECLRRPTRVLDRKQQEASATTPMNKLPNSTARGKSPMTTVTLRMPEEVVADLKHLAPLLGFRGYQPLIRAYVGEGLRKDRERLGSDALWELIASLKRKGVSRELLEEALAETMRQ